MSNCGCVVLLRVVTTPGASISAMITIFLSVKLLARTHSASMMSDSDVVVSSLPFFFVFAGCVAIISIPSSPRLYRLR